MVLPLESNLTLIFEVFLPWVIHADNLPVLVSIMKINWHLNHIHPLLIVLRRGGGKNHLFQLLLY